jgi:hypothetical protein
MAAQLPTFGPAPALIVIPVAPDAISKTARPPEL